MIVLKANINPRYVYQQIENAVAFATVRVYLDILHKRLQEITVRLEMCRP